MDGIDVFPHARETSDISKLPTTDTQISFKSTLNQNIFTAATTGLKTAQITTVGKTAADVRYTHNTLKQLGYGAELVGTNLVVTWP